MRENRTDLGRPIGVVLFCGGPTLDPAVLRFLGLLESHPEIELLGGFCQSQGQNLKAVVKDLWMRRRFLAVPILSGQFLRYLSGWMSHPLSTLRLRRASAQRSNQIRFVSNIHSEKVLERVRLLSPDLGLIYGAPILKPNLFEIPCFGTLGIHHGKVPEYRGKKTTFWAMFNGEQSVGVTIQRVNSGLDTGDVVKRGEVLVGQRSQKIVWNELEALGLQLYIQSIVEVKRGTARFSFQGVGGRRLYKDPRLNDILRFHWRQLKSRASSKLSARRPDPPCR